MVAVIVVDHTRNTIIINGNGSRSGGHCRSIGNKLRKCSIVKCDIGCILHWFVWLWTNNGNDVDEEYNNNRLVGYFANKRSNCCCCCCSTLKMLEADIFIKNIFILQPGYITVVVIVFDKIDRLKDIDRHTRTHVDTPRNVQFVSIGRNAISKCDQYNWCTSFFWWLRKVGLKSTTCRRHWRRLWFSSVYGWDTNNMHIQNWTNRTSTNTNTHTHTLRTVRCRS